MPIKTIKSLQAKSLQPSVPLGSSASQRYIHVLVTTQTLGALFYGAGQVDFVPNELDEVYICRLLIDKKHIPKQVTGPENPPDFQLTVE